MKNLTSHLLLLFLFPVIVFGQTPAKDWYEKGVKLKNEKQSAEALKAFQEALKLKADFPDAIYESGWCQNDIKDYTAALKSLRQARSFWPAVPKVYFELAYAFENIGNTDSAIENYNLCLQLKPDYSGASKRLGYLYYNKDEYITALKYFQKFEEMSKDPVTDYQFWYRKGFCCNALKQYEQAKTALSKSLEFKTDYLNTYLELGFACTKLKQDDEAINWFKKGIEVDPKSHIPYNGIAEVYRDNKKDMMEAMNWYGKTLEINPNERKGNFGMGYCLNSTQKYAEAVPYLEKAIQYEPTYTAAYVELGYSQFKLGNFYTAMEKMDKALSLNPKNENARFYKGLIYISQGNKQLAQKMADELKDLNSKNAPLLQDKINKM
jgi:tetratricopeptide (TPR) repeat protein